MVPNGQQNVCRKLYAGQHGKSDKREGPLSKALGERKWLIDYNDNELIYQQSDSSDYMAVGYSLVNDSVTIEGEAYPVVHSVGTHNSNFQTKTKTKTKGEQDG